MYHDSREANEAHNQELLAAARESGAVIDPPANTNLHGHTGPETAVYVSSYPYGRLRCIMRHWLEYRKGKGTRWMSQTNDPKAAGLKWNKPKGSTYQSGLMVLFTDDIGHIQRADLSPYDVMSLEGISKVDGYKVRHAASFTEVDRVKIEEMRGVAVRYAEKYAPKGEHAVSTAMVLSSHFAASGQ